jgi:hypothetical protein
VADMWRMPHRSQPRFIISLNATCSSSSETHQWCVLLVMPPRLWLPHYFKGCVQPARRLSFSARRLSEYENVPQHRKRQTETPLKPLVANAGSTNTSNKPRVSSGRDASEMMSSVDTNFNPVTHKSGELKSTGMSELDVGEIEGGSFRVEPVRRTGEDLRTMRARLLCS